MNERREFVVRFVVPQLRSAPCFATPIFTNSSKPGLWVQSFDSSDKISEFVELEDFEEGQAVPYRSPNRRGVGDQAFFAFWQTSDLVHVADREQLAQLLRLSRSAFVGRANLLRAVEKFSAVSQAPDRWQLRKRFATVVAHTSRKIRQIVDSRNRARVARVGLHQDWFDLRSLAAVGTTRSLAAAAFNLKVSTSEVERGVALLERRLQKKLVALKGDQIELTQHGERVFQRVRDMLGPLTDIPADLPLTSSGAESKSRTGRRRVVIAAHETIATYWLAQSLPAFQDRHPEIDLLLQVTSDDPHLPSDEAVISIQQSAPASHLNSLALGRIHYIPFASRRYLDGHGGAHNHLIAARHSLLNYSKYADQVFSSVGDRRDFKSVSAGFLESNSSSVILELCASGGGVAVLPSYVAASERRIVALPLAPFASTKLWMVFTEKAEHLELYQPVFEWLRNSFSHERSPWFGEKFVSPERREETE